MMDWLIQLRRQRSPMICRLQGELRKVSGVVPVQTQRPENQHRTRRMVQVPVPV